MTNAPEPGEYVFMFSIVKGEQPDADGERLDPDRDLGDGPDAFPHPIPEDVMSWLEEHHVGTGDVWLMLTPAHRDVGTLHGLIAQRTVHL
jgi:hypothetical protein